MQTPFDSLNVKGKAINVIDEKIKTNNIKKGNTEMKALKMVLKLVFVILIVIGFARCASTGTKVSYAGVEREQPRIKGIVDGLIHIGGGALNVLSGNPLGVISGFSDMTIRSYDDFKSVNTQTIKIEEHEDGSVTTKPVN